MTIELDVEIEEREVHLSIELAPIYGGIGAYEYWGSKCFDRGRIDEWELMDVDWEGEGVTPKQVDDWLERNWDTVEEAAFDKAQAIELSEP